MIASMLPLFFALVAVVALASIVHSCIGAVASGREILRELARIDTPPQPQRRVAIILPLQARLQQPVAANSPLRAAA